MASTPAPERPAHHKWAKRLHDPALFIGALLLIHFSRTAPLWPAFVLIGLGEALQLWAAANLLKLKTVSAAGPYACVRNPMYLGRLILGAGLVLLLDVRWYVLGPYLIAFCLYVHARVKGEEERLTRELGEPYLEYCRRVPRWFPRCPPRGAGVL